MPDGTIEGFVGGQCAQNSVRKAALGALQSGESVLLRVLPDGEVHFPEAPGASVVVNPCLSGGALEIFLAPQIPGTVGPDLRGHPDRRQTLADMAEVWVSTCSATATESWTQATAVVIASHGGPEAETIRAALDAGVGYIGLVASRVRGAAIAGRAGAHRGRAGPGTHAGRAAHRREDPCGDRGVDRRRDRPRHPGRRPTAPVGHAATRRPGVRHDRTSDAHASTARTTGSAGRPPGVPATTGHAEAAAAVRRYNTAARGDRRRRARRGASTSSSSRSAARPTRCARPCRSTASTW